MQQISLFRSKRSQHKPKDNKNCHSDNSSDKGSFVLHY